MRKNVLQTNQLSKKYTNHLALNKVNVTIKEGSIYGLIGQNGAGKSTLTRIVMGLAFQTEGAYQLFGQFSEAELVEGRKRVGTMIEGPALYPHMTAAENLEAHRRLKGIPGRDCVEKTLQLVGLANTGKKKARNFSLGMKQRLGLGIALLGDPDFLILDEPINGLDPMGVMEIRELLKKLNQDYGITMLISSHILSELHLLATDYGFIHQGKILEEISAQQLEEKCRHFLHIKVDNPDKGAIVLAEQFPNCSFEVNHGGIIKLFHYERAVREISKALTANQLIIEELMPMGEDLESYFKNLIGGEGHD